VEFEEIVDHLVGAGFDAMEMLGADEDKDDYRVASGWTEKGVRGLWAELQLLGALRGYTDVLRPDGSAKKPRHEGGAS
jgi:hypothetical protein